jgi:hypothetical protein
MHTCTRIAVHLVAPEELPDGADATVYITEEPAVLEADFYCSSATPQGARKYIADVIAHIRRIELA